jgi:zona occludens toxin
MIELYTGFVGSGKSYHAVSRGTQIADAPLGNRWVVANFPIKKKQKFLAKIPILKRFVKEHFVDPRWIFKINDELTVDYLIKTSHEKGWYGKESQCLLIIDEAGILFNSRDWNVKPAERKAWIAFLSQSRKFGYDVVFIVQDARMMDRQIRSLAEYEVQHKKLNNAWFCKLLPVTAFACVSFWSGIKNMSGSLYMHNKTRRRVEGEPPCGGFPNPSASFLGNSKRFFLVIFSKESIVFSSILMYAFRRQKDTGG